MKAAEQLARFINNPKINKRDNDLRLMRGGPIAQFRFNATEASALVKAISALPAEVQPALVRELHRRSKQRAAGQVNFITAASAKVINGLAAKLRLEQRFEVVSTKKVEVKGKIYKTLPAREWAWFEANTVLGRLPMLYDEESDSAELKKLGMRSQGRGRWTAPDGTWVDFGGDRTRLGFQKWHLGQLPYNDRIQGR